MTYFGDGFKDIFLAGIGALSMSGEKAKELVDRLIARGEITVEQGKSINSELKHKVEETACAVRYDLLEARMAAMTAQERAEFAAKAAEFAAKTAFTHTKTPPVANDVGNVCDESAAEASQAVGS